jgi:hypothetical protein
MIVGIGLCMLVIGLIGIVILQMVRSKLLEGFIYNNGAGCLTNQYDNSKNCKLKVGPTLSESDYKEWCENCTTTEGNCVWDDEKKDCFPDSTYVMKDPTIPDANTNPCDGPCSAIGSESTCNRCEKCVTCVGKVDFSNSTSDNTCIDKSDYTQEKCPNTLPFDFGGNDDPYSSLPSDNDDPVPAKDETPDEEEARHRKERDAIDTADTMDYTTEESPESAKAKIKNNQAKFLRDFQEIVHNEALNEQGMTTANSQEYLKDKVRRRRENMKPNQKRGCPDMSEYVRKDSIPCWGCNLD